MSETHRAHLAMLLFAALISTTFSFGVQFAGDLDPAALTILRLMIASSLYVLMLVGLRRWRLPNRHEALQALLLGASVGSFFVTSFIALRVVGATEVGVITASIPLMTAIIAYLALGQRASPRLIAGLVVAALGVVFVLIRGSLDRLLRLEIGTAEITLLLGCLAYAGYSPLIRGLDRGTPALLVSCWTAISGLLVVGIFGAPAVVATDWLALPFRAYAGVTYLAVFTTVLSFFLIQYASLRLPQAKVVAYAYAVPVFTLAGELLTTGRWPDLPALIGAGVITAAMVVLQTARVTPAAPPTPDARDGEPARDRR